MKTSIASAISFVLLSSLVTAHAQEQGTGSQPAPATQTTEASKKSKEKKEEVIAVTGTRIKRVDMEAAAPLTIVGREEIQASGKQTVTDIIKTLPAAVGNSVTTTTTNGGGGGSGNIALRGLDPSSTLVLLNGRRLPLDAFGSSPDMNAIPVAAIERIEVLQDGASAIYGSDAIAGVINIITRKNYEGVDFNLFLGQASKGDLETASVDLTYGVINDKGSLLLGVNTYSQGNVASRDRDVSKQALNPSSATPNAHVISSAGNVISNPTTAGEIPTQDDYRPYVSANDSYNYSSITDAIMSQKRRSVFLSGDYSFNSDLKVFFESYYTNTLSNYNSAPTPLFTGQETGNITVAETNPYNSFDEDLTDARKRFLQFGPRGSEGDSDTFRAVAGLEGNIAKWKWDLAYNHGESKTRSTTKNLINKTNLQLGIGDPGPCTAVANLGCVPVNILGPDGSLTDPMINWLRINASDYTKTQLDAITLNFVGDLAETSWGTIGMAVGVEGRKEDYNSKSDPNSEAYNTVGSTNAQSTRGDRDVQEIYAEVIVPMTQLAELDLAARFSDYDDFGSSTNPKVGLKIRPFDGFIVRGSYSTGFRAPSLVELYQGQQENFATLDDWCSTPGNCAVTSDADINQFLALQGGNPDLDAEESDSFTFGLAYSWTTFNIKADYFSIETKNAIDTSAQYVLDQFRKNGRFADKVTVDPATNNVKTIEAVALNLSSRKVEGVDFAADYALRDAPGGNYSFNLLASHYIKYMNQADKEAPFENVVGLYSDSADGGRGSIPKWKGLFDFGWENFGFDAGATINGVSELRAPGASEKYQKLAAWTTMDIRGGYDFQNFGKVTVGVNNLTDAKPPVSDAAFNDNIDARTHNLIGRFYYARWGVQL